MKLEHVQAASSGPILPFTAMTVSLERPSSIAHEFADRARGLWVGMQVRTIARSWDVAERWDDLSPLQRAVARTVGCLSASTAVTAAVLLGRTTGVAAHGLEESGLLQQLPAAGGVSTVDFPTHSRATELTEAITTTLHHDGNGIVDGHGHNNDIIMPRDVDEAPQAVKLEVYDPDRHDGTIWDKVVAYAHDMGYDNLTERQKHEAVSATLSYQGLTWQEARDLSPDYRVQFLTPSRMEEILGGLDAKRMHAPVVAGTDAQLPSVLDTPPPPASPPVIPLNPAAAVRSEHTHGWLFKGNETATGWVLGGSLLAGVGMGIYAAHQRARRSEVYELWLNERLTTPPVAMRAAGLSSGPETGAATSTTASTPHIAAPISTVRRDNLAARTAHESWLTRKLRERKEKKVRKKATR